jgi:hypothetical protein
MSNHLRIILASVALAIVFTGCGSTNLTPRLVLERPLTERKAVYFSADASVAEDVDKEVSDLETKVMKQLKKEKLFQTVMLGKCTDSCTNTVNIDVTITEVRKVSGFARFMIGWWAGKASMSSEVTFIDGASGNVLGTYLVDVNDGSNGDTGSLVSRTCKAIVKLIKTNGK